MSTELSASGLPVPTEDDRTMGMLVHLLSALMGWLGPLILFFVKSDSPFVKFHALQSLYLNLLAIPLILVTCGTAAILVLVVDILWALKAKDGEWAKIPVVGDWAWPADLPRVEG